MFDIGWTEMLVIGAVALIVIGPKELPRALRGIGQVVSKIRSMASEFQGTFNEAMREAEFDQIRKEVETINAAARDATNIDFNPAQTIRDEIKGAMEDKPAALPAGEPQPITPVEPQLAPPAPPQPAVFENPVPEPKQKPKPKQVTAKKAGATSRADVKAVSPPARGRKARPGPGSGGESA